MTENDLTVKLVDWMAKDFDSVKREIPNMGQSIDVVGRLDNNYYAIEVKLRDWKTAIKQCKAHRLVADYIYIAIPIHNIPQELIDCATKHGYGIYHYSNSKWVTVINAVRNLKIWKPQKDIFISDYQQVNRECIQKMGVNNDNITN